MHCTRIALLAAATLAATPVAAQVHIGPGETVRGTLDRRDPHFDHGAHYDAYVIRGRPGERVLVRMRSADFDTYLRWGSDGKEGWVDVQGDDDGGEGTDSRLAVTLGALGEFQLRASGFSDRETGAYELEVTEITPVVPEPIEVGEAVEGTLTDDDHEGEQGPEDHWTVRGEPGSTFTAYLESGDFDTYLAFGVVRGGELQEYATDDDGGEGTNSALVGRFAGGGDHRLVVRSYSGQGTGAYTLTLVAGEELVEDAMDTVPETETFWTDSAVIWGDSIPEWVDNAIVVVPGPDLPAGHEDRPVVFSGEPVEGSLGEGEGQHDEGARYAEYILTAMEGERLTVELSSEEFDPVVSIGLGRDRLYRALETDDGSGPGQSAQLRFDVPQYGLYVVRVTSARPRQQGDYRLLVRIDVP